MDQLLLGIAAGLGPGDSVLNGNPPPPRKGAHQPPPLSGSCLLWPDGWMNQDTTWYGGTPRPMRHCYMGTQLPSTQRGIPAPTFRPTALSRIPAGPHFTQRPCCRLGIARRVAVVAILSDNYHPSIVPVLFVTARPPSHVLF